MIKAILFDLDDTLYHEEDFVRSGFRAVARYAALRLDSTEAELYKSLLKIYRRDGRGQIFDVLLKRHDKHSKAFVRKLIQVYRTHLPNIATYHGTMPTLRTLQKGYVLGLITDGMGSVQRRKVRALRLNKLFKKIIYTHDKGVKFAKPSPVPFLHMLRALKIRSGEAIFVGNNLVKDIAGAENVGIRAVHMLRIKKKSVTRKKDNHFIIRSLRELPKVLKRIES